MALEISLVGSRLRLCAVGMTAVGVTVAISTCQRPLAILCISWMRKDAGMGCIVGLFHLARAVHREAVGARGHRWVQVDAEREDVEGEYEGDDPLQDSRLVVVLFKVGGNESDGKK